VQRDEGLSRLEALGFEGRNALTLWEHFDDAEQRGKLGHGYSRIPWLETFDGYDPKAEPSLVVDDAGYQRWNGNGAIGYIVLAHVVAA
jgi:LDH2 family malate/lactate/ureidoglycolate dehydrogenase